MIGVRTGKETERLFLSSGAMWKDLFSAANFVVARCSSMINPEGGTEIPRVTLRGAIKKVGQGASKYEISWYELAEFERIILVMDCEFEDFARKISQIVVYNPALKYLLDGKVFYEWCSSYSELNKLQINAKDKGAQDIEVFPFEKR
ncbi:hypothetical protein ACFL2R_02420 [Patescibacteria group bacterium]